MVKRIVTMLFLASLLTLSGCASICAKYQTQKPPVYVYVQQPIPAPPVVERPALKILEINASSSDGDVVVYYRTDLQQLLNYSLQLEDIVKKYRDLSNKPEERTTNGK